MANAGAQKVSTSDPRADAVVEIGKAIALGAVPFAGQAIDIYDTIEGIWGVYSKRNSTQQEKDEVTVDLILALIGWMPGPGDGIKKIFRLVNREPKKYAPVMMDLVRYVAQKSGVNANIEQLILDATDSAKLKPYLDSAKKVIEDSSLYGSLPKDKQKIVGDIFRILSQVFMASVALLERRVIDWLSFAPNNVAFANKMKKRGGHKEKVPESKKQTTSQKGDNAANSSKPNKQLAATIATQSLDQLTTALVGDMGEHIADYYCAEKLNWGKTWKGHDKGASGTWGKAVPSAQIPGKLSNSYKLFQLKPGKPNGHGIDAVWRVDQDKNNDGKPFAIVEAKSHLPISSKPHGYFRGKNTNKPSMTGRLGVNGMDAVKRELKTLGALLLDGEKSGTADANSYADTTTGSGKPNGGSGKPSGKPNAGSGKPGKNNSTTSTPSSGGKASKTQLIVQMSEEWISKNISASVPNSIYSQVIRNGRNVYSRYIVYSPLYSDTSIETIKAVQVPSAIKDSINHAKVLMAGMQENESLHREHAAVLYNEAEVKTIVNRIKTKLKTKYSKSPNVDISKLNQEK
ncbi:hypothetical protein [Acinetobacter guillouiae]|uniref:hypothetical protein n=1 Tax=Acinetobacter guillouiae TaxID=106649 RepID=UPI0012508943|nr:hypothetical protein [Acinetobacter guillouiae]